MKKVLSPISLKNINRNVERNPSLNPLAPNSPAMYGTTSRPATAESPAAPTSASGTSRLPGASSDEAEPDSLRDTSERNRLRHIFAETEILFSLLHTFSCFPSRCRCRCRRPCRSRLWTLLPAEVCELAGGALHGGSDEEANFLMR
eukprot:scaffold148_cov371-Prasinococcus_capsulatus_cf.AAC.7